MSPRSPLSRPQDVVLHIGTGKTGTSSVQRFLGGNRARLKELGMLYPETPGPARHGRLSLFVKSGAELRNEPNWSRQRPSDPPRFRKVFRRRLFAEIEAAGLSRVLLSDEVLYGSSEAALRRLRRFTDRIAGSVRLVLYLRRQDDHLISRYQQGVKIGYVMRLSDWAKHDMSTIYDYDARLRMWEQLLSPTEFVVRRFERERFAHGSLHQDFLDAAGIEARADGWQQFPDSNESLDAESVEFLRLLNLYRVENEGAKAGLIDNRGLVRRLAGVSQGPVLTLPDSELDELMSQWRQSNRAVARDWLGDATGELFRAPRRTHGTTTDQRLDPSRLEEFLRLAELPEGVHAPFRLIVDREARLG